MKTNPVTLETAVLFLAKKKAQGHQHKTKKKKNPRSDTVAADFLYKNFTAAALREALTDPNGEDIGIRWYAMRLVDIISDEASKAGDRLNALERIKDLILLGAIQETELSDELRRRTLGSTASVVQPIAEDPFARKGLKVS